MTADNRLRGSDPARRQTGVTNKTKKQTFSSLLFVFIGSFLLFRFSREKLMLHRVEYRADQNPDAEHDIALDAEMHA